jgi:hypothetical protein
MLVPLNLPVLVKPVAVIGGPTGAFVGPTGTPGLQGAAVTGVTGLLGPTGQRGATGPTGLHGLDSALAGATGKRGPDVLASYPGPVGPTGPAVFVPADRVAYFENAAGITGIGAGGAYTGCGFIYTVKRAGARILVMFTGLAQNTTGAATTVEIHLGPPPAPSFGVSGHMGGAIDCEQTIYAPGLSVPFILTGLETRDFAGARWFDLYVTAGSGAGAGVRNIQCLILEM